MNKLLKLKSLSKACLLIIGSTALISCNSDSDPQNASSGGVSPGGGSGGQRALVYGTLISLDKDSSDNPVAYIPPQCYTDPIFQDQPHNPCYVCHTPSKEPNYLNDVDVQVSYSAPTVGDKNHWSNLFIDRTAKVKQISDTDILSYVRQDNYLNEGNEITLAKKLAQLPKEWDRNNNGRWDGYTPDVYFNFDAEGFDKKPDGSLTGWRVFAYYPFPGTFMPTNGSTDDVLIRLPEAFRQNAKGEYDQSVYKLNFAILEALLTNQDVEIPATDETQYGVDLDKNGQLSTATRIKYDWAPLENKLMSYVGLAKTKQQAGEIKLASRLFPKGTEFVHSVRYLDIKQGQVSMAPRMKELRYAQKTGWRNYDELRTLIDQEVKERHDFPDRVKSVLGNAETGLHINQGWTYQGFIEDDAGELRPQTYEETYFCMGCHGGVGAVNDTVFSFSRKFNTDSFKQGWYHWLEKDLSGVPDRQREDGKGEYAFYLENNPTANEYRTNKEVLNKFFNSDNSPKAAAFATLEKDISTLLIPSPERAMQLNKAYKVIVDEQSYRLGREAHVKPLANVKRSIEIDAPTGIKEPLSYY